MSAFSARKQSVNFLLMRIDVKLIIFDLDGTLVDSVPDLALAVNLMLDAQGRSRVSETSVRKWVGNGALRLLKRALTGTMQGEPDPCLLEEARAQFFVAYWQHLSDRSELYPGVAEVLSRLQSDGCQMACVTNKPAAFTLPLLKNLGINQYLQPVISGDTLRVRKPDPGPLLEVLRTLDVEPQQTVMVGDSISDYHAALASGIRVMLVSYGYHQGVDLQALHLQALLNDFSELPKQLGLMT